MINYRHCRICGSALFFTSAAPYRGVKMKLAHFHSACMKADKSARTEGPAIAALRANRVVPKVPPKTVGPLRGEWFLGEPAGGGLTTLQCQRTEARFKHGGGKPEWGSPQNRRRQFCGVPGRRGEQYSHVSAPHEPVVSLLQNKNGRRVPPVLRIGGEVSGAGVRCF